MRHPNGDENHLSAAVVLYCSLKNSDTIIMVLIQYFTENKNLDTVLCGGLR